MEAVTGDPERLAAYNDDIAGDDSLSSSGSASSGSAAVRAPDAQAPASTYYDNCSAARAAGAAPVRTGDPGYGRHLDRDGDGVGCE